MLRLNIGTDPEAACVYQATGEWRSMVNIFADPNKTTAIGLDGQRPTASLEFRPGVQKSAEQLVHKLFDLINRVRGYYHPPAIAYRCGAWVSPEPLGGHIHFSWNTDLTPGRQQIRNLLTGLNVVQHSLIHEVFDAEQLQHRQRYAHQHGKDFALLGAFRAVPHKQGSIQQVLDMKHIEYRYTPSWLLTPELAYTFLASAEAVAHLALLENYAGPWRVVKDAVMNGGSIGQPPGAPSMHAAYVTAKRHLNWQEDFTDNWVVS